jgi:hypothetical protein
MGHLADDRDRYPTAMIMANGSILVVGGEAGSNGAVVPTLEILPPVGPVLYMEWLNRTDPYATTIPDPAKTSHSPKAV